MNILLNSFHLNGHTLRFYPQTYKVKPILYSVMKYHMKVRHSRVRCNGHTLGFYKQTWHHILSHNRQCNMQKTPGWRHWYLQLFSEHQVTTLSCQGGKNVTNFAKGCIRMCCKYFLTYCNQHKAIDFKTQDIKKNILLISRWHFENSS